MTDKDHRKMDKKENGGNIRKRVLKVRPVTVVTEKLAIRTDFIKLDSAVKFSGIADTGGMAKLIIEEGEVRVNGEVCLMRGKKLYPGDSFSYRKNAFIITKDNED